MLTPDQILKAKGSLPGAGGTTAPSQAMTPEQAQAWIGGAPSQNTAQPSPSLSTQVTDGAKDVGSNYMSSVAPAANDVMGGGNIGAAVDDFSKGKIASGVEKSTLGVASDAVQAIFAPIAAPLQTLLDHTAKANATNPNAPDYGHVNTPEAQTARQQLSDWAKQNPLVAKTLGDAFNVGTAALGSGALDTSVADAATGVKNTVVKGVNAAKDTAAAAKGAIVGTPEEQAAAQATKQAAQAAKQTQTSIDAVNPDLSGKKLVNAYKQTVTGQRDVTPSSIFKEQGLTPDQQTTNLGTRLQDLKLGSDHVQNLDTLSKAMTNTEGKIDTALEGDPKLNVKADKPTLLSTLESLKPTMPREFSAIKDSKTAYKNVIDYAKETIAKTPDTIKGLRIARNAFDTQAKIEYPNAFKEGTIDVKTPAGRAIKQARDAINAHLYKTAPNGSEIQDLIGREADIYRATDNIAPKAAATHGQTSVKQALDKHPIIKAGVTAAKRAIPFGIGTHL